MITCARDGVQRLAATQALPFAEEEDAGHRLEASPGDDEEVRGLMARLPERQRLVLFLRYYADLDYRAIAVVQPEHA